MALTVTALVTTAHAVQLTIDGGFPPYVTDASPGGNRGDYRVRSTYSTVPGDADKRIALDGDAPLNLPVVYVVTDSHGAQAQTAPVTVVSSMPILADATDPGLSMPVVVLSQKPNRWEARSVWWDVLGSPAPFASVAPMRYRNGTTTFRTRDLLERGTMIALLSRGTPLTLRAPTPDAVDDQTILVESVEETLVLEEDPSGPTLFALTYQGISRELGPTVVDPGRSYASALLESPTYAAVLASFPTYDAWRIGAPGGTAGVELAVNGDMSAGSASWDNLWTSTGVVFTYAGTASARAAGAGPLSAVLQNLPLRDYVTTAGVRYRIAGRMRSSHATTHVTLECLSNSSADGNAQYFAPGLALQSFALVSPGSWVSFSHDFTIPAGDNVWTPSWRADDMVDSAVVEWDDLSVRVVT